MREALEAEGRQAGRSAGRRVGSPLVGAAEPAGLRHARSRRLMERWLGTPVAETWSYFRHRLPRPGCHDTLLELENQLG